MRILFLTARLPYPPNRGDRLRAYHFLRVLSRQHRVSLLSFVSDAAEAGLLAGLRPFCEDVQLVHRAPWQSAVGVGLNAWRPTPLQSLYYRSSTMQGAVDRLLDRGGFDLVYVHLFRMAQYVSERRAPFRVLDLTDVISGEIERSLPFRSPFWRLVYRLELPRVRRYEREMAGRFDETWVISEAERAALAGEGGPGRVAVVTNGVESERFRPQQQPAAAPVLAFVGHMGVLHNVDAAERLAQEVLPRVRAAVPEAQLRLIGAEPGPRVLALAGEPGVRVLGHVADLNAALGEAAVFVAPLRFAAGVQNKVLEAMAAGLPVVTTATVNEGLGATTNEHLLLAEDEAATATAVVGLLGDAAARARLGAAGRAYVRAHFRWEGVLERVEEIGRGLGE